MANWKAALRMTLDNSGVVKGLRDHQREARGAAAATTRLRDENGRFIAGAGKLDSVTAKLKGLKDQATDAGAAMGKAASAAMGKSGGGGGTNWANVAGAVSVAGTAMRGAAIAAKAVGSVFRSGMNLENLIRQLSASTEDTESLRTQMDELAKVGAKPGIDFNTAIQGSAALQSVGMSAKESRKSLEEWSNVVAAAGGNAEVLQGVLMAVRQMMTKDTIQQEDVNQILERVPQFATINAQLEKLKSNPKAYIREAVEELSKMDRVASGAQESVDGLLDSWTQFKTSVSNAKLLGIGPSMGSLATGATNFTSRLLQGKFKDAFTQVDDDVRAANRDPIDALAPSPEQIARRQEARANAENKRIEDRVKSGEKFFTLAEENARKLFNMQAEDLAMEQEIRALRIAGLNEQAEKLEDQRTLMQQVKKLAMDLNVSEEMVRDRLTEQLELRREMERIAGQKEARDMAEEQRIQGLRNAGRNREADRAEDEQVKSQALEQLKGRNVPAAEAEKLAEMEVRNRRDQRSIESTGRRRIRGAVSRNSRGLDDYDFNGDAALGFTPTMLDLNPTGGIGNGRRADRMAGMPAGQAKAGKAASKEGGLDDETLAAIKRGLKRVDEIAENTKDMARKEPPPR